jgi:hypothetical protein
MESEDAMSHLDLTVTVVKKRKPISAMARDAAVRTVPMIGDLEAYRRALDYFMVGWARGYRAAQRASNPKRKGLTTCDMP